MEDDGTKPIMGELKTVKNRWWYMENGVGPEHKKQVAAYLYMLNDSEGWLPTSESKPVLDAAFYYLDMDDISRIPVSYTPEEIITTFGEMKAKAEQLDESLRSGDIKDMRVPWKTTWECNPKYCPFTEFCHPDYPFEPPAEHPNLEKWWAGPLKVDKEYITKLLPVKTVWAILEEAGYKLDWRKRDEATM
jgi:PD-(D/E)XK nuclease superfamily